METMTQPKITGYRQLSEEEAALMNEIKDCEKRSEKLTLWECGFVDSLQRQIADGRRPSAKQVETLDTIWEHATARG